MNLTYFMETQHRDADGLRSYDRELLLPLDQKPAPRSFGTAALMGMMGGKR